MKKVRIGARTIGEGKPCFIIAEIGSNHGRSLKTAKKIIDAAWRAGADAVKFQSFTVENWLSKDFTSFPTMSGARDIKKQLKKCELPYDMYERLQRYALGKGLVCFSSPSHMDDVDRLCEAGVPAFKFGSVQITDLATITYAAKKGKPMILSTGGADAREIKEAVRAVYAAGNRNIVLLHCTALYPARMDQANLRAMLALKDIFDGPVGYSDHTTDPVTAPVAAVALGACVIEKHITLSRALKGPDHSFALEPDEFRDMVSAVRNAQKALGSRVKKLLPEEKEIMRMGRRSIVARKAIPRGVALSADMLTVKRPGYGIPSKFLDRVIGKTARVYIDADSVITWGMILKGPKK